MTELLEKAFAEASKLPDHEQDDLAESIFEMLNSEKQWDDSFARSHDVLAIMADEALAEYRAGKTQLLDLDEV